MQHGTPKANWKGGKRKLAALLASAMVVLGGHGIAQAEIVNSVVASGMVGGVPVSVSADASVDVVDEIATVLLDKQGVLNDTNSNGKGDAGETVSYSFSVTNTGNVTLKNVTLTDGLVTPTSLVLGNDTGPLGDSTDTLAAGWDSLAPGDTLNATATYTLLQSDIDNGDLVNTANVSAVTIPGTPVTGTDSVTTPLAGLVAFDLVKAGTLALGADNLATPGDQVSYTFTVTNTGTVSLTNVSIYDALLMAELPNASRVNDLVQVASIPSDPISTASLTKTSLPEAYLGAGPREPSASVANVPELPAALHVERRLVSLSANADIPAVGDRVGVYFTLTNTGEVPLTEITLLQPGDQAFGNALPILAPNTSDNATVIFTHVLTEEDILTGQIDVVSGVIAHARNHSLVQTLRGPMSLLDMETPPDLATASISPAAVASLAPGASTVFTATYSLTQADIDAGKVTNTATASAANTSQTSTDTVEVPVPRLPMLTLDKTSSLDISANNPQKADVGDVITYTFTLANPGNVTVNNLSIVDAPLGITVPASPLNGFAPGATQTFTATYLLKASDVAAGKVTNQATAGGVYGTVGNTLPVSQVSNDPATPAVDDATVTPLPAITLVKPVPLVTDTNANGYTDAGDVISYTFTVNNSGQVPLSNVNVVDRDANVVHNISAPTSITLAPGQTDTTSFTATYTLTQTDVIRGYYDNTADVFGTTADGKTVTDESDPLVPTADAPTRLPIIQIYRLAVLKPQPTLTDNNSNGIADLGDRLNYVISVFNTGNMDLLNVRVADPVANNFASTIPSLPVGGQFALNASHVITAQDMVAGEVRNVATATVDLPGGGTFTDRSDTADLNEDDQTITPLVARADVAILKPQPQIIDSDLSGDTNAGDILRYTLSVTNTGNIPLSNFNFTDILASGSFTASYNGTLEAGDTDDTTVFDYVLTAADITRGYVDNRASVTASGSGGLNASDSSHPTDLALDADTRTYVGAPAIGIVKQGTVVDLAPLGVINVGDRIDYAFTVQNMGSQNLTNVSVSDSIATVSPATTISLPIGATSTAFTGQHVITQADIDQGFVQNQATATGFFNAVQVTDQSDSADFNGNAPTITPLVQSARIALIKGQPTNSDENANGVIEPGETLTYRFRVTNLGNVTLHDLTLTELSVAVAAGGPLASLAPGATDSTTFTATHVVTQVDAIAEHFDNQARISAALTTGGALTVEDLSDPVSTTGDAVTVTPVQAYKPVLTKAAARSQIRRGEQVPYTITASNLGAGLYDIADIMPAGFDFVAGTATVNGVAVVPAESGHALSFAAISPTPQGRITVKLTLLSGTSLSTGDFVNRARIFNNATGTLLAEARATVRITEEHVFDCGEIIGRVFDDLNSNGYMDDGEEGLPGVRVVTVKGLLVTTDKYGRFHVTCADVPNAVIGSNFLMKLDTRTLPAGYALTTENPRDVRLTRGKITKLNFGAAKRRAIGLDLTRDAFNGNTTELKPKFAAGLDRLVSLLGQGRGALTITYRCNQFAPIADERVAAVEQLVQAKWKQDAGGKPLIITTNVECGN